jgi:hypothetical protein
MPNANLDVSTAQTDTELVAAPASGLQIVVDTVYVSTAGALEVDFESDGATLKWKQYTPATAAGQLSSGRNLFRCDEAESLNITTDGAVGCFVAVTYRIEPIWNDR